jgi:hypothetical protein
VEKCFMHLTCWSEGKVVIQWNSVFAIVIWQDMDLSLYYNGILFLLLPNDKTYS